MIKNVEKLAEYGELHMRIRIEKSLNKVKEALDARRYSEEPKSNLAFHAQNYKERVNNFKDNYGVEFPELQEQYEKILPEIKKYVEVK